MWSTLNFNHCIWNVLFKWICLALPCSILELLGSIKGSFIFLKGLEPPLLDHKPLDTNSRETHALLKIKVLRKVLEVVPMKNRFWLHQESSSQRFFKESSLSYLFVIWRTFFQHKGPFEKIFRGQSFFMEPLRQKKKLFYVIVKHFYCMVCYWSIFKSLKIWVLCHWDFSITKHNHIFICAVALSLLIMLQCTYSLCEMSRNKLRVGSNQLIQYSRVIAYIAVVGDVFS